MNRPSLFSLGLTAIVSVALYLPTRSLILFLRRPQDTPNVHLEYEREYFQSEGEVAHIFGPEIIGKLSLDVPETLLTSQSRLVRAKFELEVGSKEAYPFPDFEKLLHDSSYSFELVAPAALEIAPVGKQTRQLQAGDLVKGSAANRPYLKEFADCAWTLKPKETGDYTLFVDGLWQVPTGKVLPTGESLTFVERENKEFTVRILNPAGISARSESIARIVSGIVAVLGAVLAFPFFKFVFDRKQKASQAEETKKIVLTDL